MSFWAQQNPCQSGVLLRLNPSGDDGARVSFFQRILHRGYRASDEIGTVTSVSGFLIVKKIAPSRAVTASLRYDRALPSTPISKRAPVCFVELRRLA
jgi:hypothetical protein